MAQEITMTKRDMLNVVTTIIYANDGNEPT
jgi:hypothetical protein